MNYFKNSEIICVHYSEKELLQKKYSGPKSEWILWLESLDVIELTYIRGILRYDNDVFNVLMKKLRYQN